MASFVDLVGCNIGWGCKSHFGIERQEKSDIENKLHKKDVQKSFMPFVIVNSIVFNTDFNRVRVEATSRYKTLKCCLIIFSSDSENPQTTS